MKRCWMCRTDRPITEFHKDPNTSSGLSGKCKACTKVISKSFWETHTTVVVLRKHVEIVKEFIKSL